MTVKNIRVKLALLFITLGCGALLILNHKTLWLTLVGIILWSISTGLALSFAPKMPGTLIFSNSPLRLTESKSIWPWPLVCLFSACILYLLKISDFHYKQNDWTTLTLNLLGLGFLFFILEKKSSAFWVTPPSSRTKASWPWAEILVVLLGSFFLFYHLAQLPNFIIVESLYTIDKAKDFASNFLTTPFVDQWQGNPLFPSFLLGFIFKIIGVSYFTGAVFFAGLNIIGFIFFYRFLRFYIAQDSAAVTALLFSSSYWLIHYARMPLMGGGIIVAFESAALYFFAKAIEEGKIKDFIWFGITLALTLNTYIASRLVLIFFITAVIYIGITRYKEVAQQKIGWLFAWGSLALWVLPLAWYYIHSANNNIFWAERVDAVNIFSWFHDKNWTAIKGNIDLGFRMIAQTAANGQIANYPDLTVWEGLCFLAGFGWCLFRFFQPAFFILFLGFFGGISGSVLTLEATHPLRSITAAPFVYVFVGIGLDRLSRLIVSPLKSLSIQKAMRFLFFAFFLCFSVARHYDVYFRLLPKSSGMAASFDGFSYLMAHTVPQYPSGWDIYVAPHYLGFPYAFFTKANGDMGKISIFHLRAPFPFTAVPAKGAVIILPAAMGTVFQDWIHYYYPNANYKAVLNPYGDVEFKVWEITPGEIQEALKTKKHLPPTGIKLSWWNAKNQKLGEWLLPGLYANSDEWFSNLPEETGYTFTDMAYCVIEGSIRNPGKNPIFIETTGSIEGHVGTQKISKTDITLRQIPLAQVPGNWVPFRVHYIFTSTNDFDFKLLMNDASGFTPVPSDDLRPN